MTYSPLSIRTFIGAKAFNESRSFYKDLGFKEIIIDPKLSHFKLNDQNSFFLQDYYVKDWVNNSMIFLEVDDIEKCEQDILSKGLQEKYKQVRFDGIKEFEWGRVLFMHDPSGVLWHLCEFSNK